MASVSIQGVTPALPNLEPVVQRILSLPYDERIQVVFQQLDSASSLPEKLRKCPREIQVQHAKTVALNAKAFLAVEQNAPWLFTCYHNPLNPNIATTHPTVLVNRALDAMYHGKSIEQKLRKYADNPAKREKLAALIIHLYKEMFNFPSFRDMVMQNVFPKLIYAICQDASLSEVTEEMEKCTPDLLEQEIAQFRAKQKKLLAIYQAARAGDENGLVGLFPNRHDPKQRRTPTS